MTCTSWPRATSPAARRSAKRAAPLTWGVKVSAPMRIVSARGLAPSAEESAGVAGSVTGWDGLSVRRGARPTGVGARLPLYPRGSACAAGIGTPAVRWKHAPTAGRRRSDAVGSRHRLARIHGPPPPQGGDPDAADPGEPRDGPAPSAQGSGFLAWGMSQAAPFLMKRAGGPRARLGLEVRSRSARRDGAGAGGDAAAAHRAGDDADGVRRHRGVPQHPSRRRREARDARCRPTRAPRRSRPTPGTPARTSSPSRRCAPTASASASSSDAVDDLARTVRVVEDLAIGEAPGVLRIDPA